MNKRSWKWIILHIRCTLSMYNLVLITTNHYPKCGKQTIISKLWTLHFWEEVFNVTLDFLTYWYMNFILSISIFLYLLVLFHLLNNIIKFCFGIKLLQAYYQQVLHKISFFIMVISVQLKKKWIDLLTLGYLTTNLLIFSFLWLRRSNRKNAKAFVVNTGCDMGF